MIKVECVSCKSPYDVDERRIPATGMKMRCPKCAASFVVAKDGTISAASDPQPSAAGGKGFGFPTSLGPAAAGGGEAPRAPQPGAAGAFGGSSASAFGAGVSAKPVAGVPVKTLVGAPVPLVAPAGAPLAPRAPLAPDVPAAPPPAAPPPAAAPVKPLTSTMHGVAVPDLADLPALKPAPKPATPWGSLAPPSPDAKPGMARSAAGLPKGAMGVPNAPQPGAAGSAVPKASSTASAFGTGSSLKQTMIGGHVRGAGTDFALSGGGQASGSAAAQVAPPDQAEAEPDALDESDLPFVDLPAHKPSTNNAFKPYERVAQPDRAAQNEPTIDLPAPKAKAPGPAFPPVGKREDPLIDLPAPKLSAAKAGAFGNAPKQSDASKRSLEAPKPAAAGTAAKAAFGSPAPKPDSAFGRPAPKQPDLLANTGFGSLSLPPALHTPPEIDDFELDDTDGEQLREFDELEAETDVPLETPFEDPGLDLPAPKRAGAGRFGEPFAAKKSEPPMIDLPGLKPSGPKPAPRPPLAAKQPEPPRPIEPPMIDLPGLKAKPSAARAVEPPVIDLPAPKVSAPKPARPAPPPPRAAEQALVDLPALKSIDLPALKSPANSDGGFGEIDLPMAKASIDLPATKRSPASFDELDLPAPKTITDLPRVVGIADLPAVVGIADLPASRGISDLPAPMGVADLPVGKRGFGDLDLPIPKVGPSLTEEASFGDIDLEDGGSGFGDVELPRGRGSIPGIARSAADEANFGNLELGSPLPPYPEQGGFDDLRGGQSGDLGSVPPALGGNAGYGEAGLESGANDDMEFGIQEAEEGFALPPEILRRQRGEDLEAPPDKGKRVRFVLIGVALCLVSIGGAGAALGFTDYGYFGMYFLEQFLPEAGDPRYAREAIARAEKSAASDTYTDVRRALVELGGARHTAGLNRELLTRSLLHEALYLVRFGADTASSARVAAIMQRLDERHGIAPGMALARAADAARRSAWADAEARLAEARAQTPSDAYVHLLAGEVALRQGKLDDANKAFAAALKQGAGARAQWGLAREALARPDRAAQDSAVAETLKLSPLHAEARVAQARMLFLSGKEERAVLTLRQALGMDPLDDKLLRASKPAKAEGYSLLGYIHEQRGRLHLARKAYDDALSADPYLIEALLGSGRVLLRERRFDDALARFESGLNLAQKAPNESVLTGRKAEVEARLGQSRAQLMLGRAPNAKATLTALLKEYPDDAEVVLAMGQAEEAIGNRESAETMFKKSIELAPKVFSGYLALAQYHFKHNQADQASEALNDAASKVEENAEMRRMLGQSELARGRLDSAAHEFKRALELDPQDLDAHFGLGVTYRRAGQLDAARVQFDEIGARDAQYGGLTLERGQLLEAQGDYGKAVENYRAALAKDANDSSLMLRLGAAQTEGGMFDDAEQTLDKVIHQTPNSADAEYYIGRVAFARGRGPDALTHFDRALALDSTVAVYHLYAARAALEMVNLGRTIEEAEAALARDPRLADAYWVRGIVRVRSGAVKDALKDAARALELNPKRYEAHELMAECYDELRQLPQAVEAYQTALAADPARGEWWYKLGRVHVDLGARAAGNEALDKAIKLGDAQDPPPYWLVDSYRLLGESARAGGDKRGAVAAFKRYLKLASPGALDRADVTKQLRDWNVELED